MSPVESPTGTRGGKASLEPLRLKATAASWVGLRRARNEDAASVNGERVAALSEMVHYRPRHVLLVADGMGGHVGGAVASDIAVGFLEAQAAGLVDPRSSSELVEAANRAVYDAVDQNPDLCGMGTTIAGAIATANEVVWFNVGDSRIYLATSSGIRRLSTDHSIGSALTQCLGGSFSLEEVSPACGAEPWGPGDRLLLCSDGLTNLVEDAELELLLLFEEDDAKLVRELFRVASARGAPDNVTVVLATNDSSAAGPDAPESTS